MIRKLLLPVLAALGLAFAVYTVLAGAKPIAIAAPAALPALAPFENTIAGAGIVEAQTQNIAVGTPTAGIAAEVLVDVGSRVAQGAPLFKLDDRNQRAELAVRQSALDSARAELARLTSLPRAEDLPPLRARRVAVEAELADVKNQLALAESLTDKRAMATQEWDRRRFAVRAVEARLAEVAGQLALLEAGAWKPDVDIARAQVDAADARLRAQQTEIERLTVRAPVDGTVLQLNLRVGEFAQSGMLVQPLLVLGNLDRMRVRVDIDENDAWRFRSGASARAYVRGNRELEVGLEFVRVEPYVIPKRSLTGESTERVDTRVLQVLYSFDPKALAVYVGQQMDVFIEAPRSSASASAASQAGSAPDARKPLSAPDGGSKR